MENKEALENITSLFTSPEDKELILRAYLFAEKAHAGHKRYSGEPYTVHLLGTANNLASFGADAETIAAGILHDVIEDCGVTKETLEKEFGQNVAQMVSGVSKLGDIKYTGHERYAENMRHLFLAVAHDVRVILIKLADRLHNVKTLQYVPKEKQKRIALETLEIYGPVAHRLGMGKLRAELQDYAFPYAYPEAYKETEALLAKEGKERERYIEKVYKSLGKELAKAELHEAKISYRIKDHYSIYHKLLKKDMVVAKIYDIYAVRILVPTLEDCYRVLGIIHGMWRPLPGRIKDYIANPKTNGYQSIHTTVFTGDGGIAEIQIRTREMHLEAEYGVAAHLMYKEKKEVKGKSFEERISWLSRIKELHEEHGASATLFLKNLKLDFFDERIFVFTPAGDVVEMPEGATVLDFAFHIHSDLGLHATGGRVNGKFVALNTPLKSGDIIEIEKKKNSKPTRRWLSYVTTTTAAKHIRAHLTKTEKSIKE